MRGFCSQRTVASMFPLGLYSIPFHLFPVGAHTAAVSFVKRNILS